MYGSQAGALKVSTPASQHEACQLCWISEHCVLQLASLQLAHREMQAQLGDITAMQQILVAELGATRSLWAMAQSDNELLTAKLRELHAQVG